MESSWEDSIKEGEIFEGKVVSLASFGAFVEVLPGSWRSCTYSK